MNIKEINETLEDYGLTEQEIQDCGIVDWDIVLDAMKLSSIFSLLGYEIEVDELVDLLKKKKNEKLWATV